MKTVKTLFIALLVLAISPLATAQTAEEIVANYFENTGGLDQWKNIESIKYVGSVDLGGMVIGFDRYVTADGKSATIADVQGQSFYQDVFDGEVLWGTNQMTMGTEKSDAESTANYKLEADDLISPLLGYKEKGYTLELIGNETIEGTETLKVKLDMGTFMKDGVEQANVAYFYFETENYVPILEERMATSGQAKGYTLTFKYSDYQEANGLYFPFAMTQGVKEFPGEQTITMTDIVVNGEIDNSIYAFPAPAATGTDGKN
ncbi:MAG: outer membrane lipoprotein-sorting protein [Bacteroidota bacterium]